MNDNPYTASADAAHEPQPARTDELTNLPNRAMFLAHLEAALNTPPCQQASTVAVLLLDCDQFKTINDSLGHPVGDKVLVAITQRLQASLAKQDIIARIDGDEFAILLPAIQHLTHALATAEGILHTLNTPFQIDNHEIFISASMGIVTSDTPTPSAADLLRDADTALYHAKALGRGRYSVFDATMHVQAVQRLQMATELRRALKQEEFCVFYQPIVSLATGLITGFEALVRWQHPERQLLAPAEFLPFAEELGLSVDIDRHVLRAACHQLRQWLSRFPTLPHLTVSVNLSGQQLEHPDLVSMVRSVLRETRLPPENLILEMTENTMIEHKDAAIQTLEHLRVLGVRVSLDDFGTGYSSLSYLHHLPVSTLKVDRSFVSSMDVSAQAGVVTNAIITLAHALGMDVVAEGIETVQHLHILRRANCERAQGFFFSRPVDATQAANLLEEARQRMVDPPEPAAFAPPESTQHAPAPAVPAAIAQAAAPPLQSGLSVPVPLPVPEQKSVGASHADPLTGVLNRALLQPQLAEATEHSARTGEPYALAIIDLDHFKSVNDAFGHTRGDEVLIEFAARVRAATRAQDSIFRYGGDEFVLLLRNTTSEQAHIFAERLLNLVRSSSFDGDPPLSLSISMGIAVFPDDSQNSDELFKLADERNYQAKRAGRGRAVLHDMPHIKTISLDGPARLLERDQQLQTLHTFLQELAQQQRGILQIIGEQGSGFTRFLAEASKAARLQGYAVLNLRGSSALKERVYGVLSDLPEEWHNLPLPGKGVLPFAAALQENLTRMHANGLVITLDDGALIDQATSEFLHALVALPNIAPLALIAASNGVDSSFRLPQGNVLRMQTALEPLSLNGVRSWVRHSLNWEMPDDVVLWFSGQTGGQPAAIRRGLHYLLEQELIYQTATGWSYRADIITTRITAQVEAQADTPRHNLPIGQSEFVGREADITRVRHLLRQQRAVTIIGLGGLGKSRLAIQVAAESAEAFADGVCYVQLAHLNSADFLIYTLADALGISLAGTQSPREQVLFHLSTRNLLLLLDNFEHLREDTALLQEIIEHAAGVHLLITSRDRLVFPGAVMFELRGLSCPGNEDVAEIAHSSAVQLFVRRARQAHANFTLSEENQFSVSRICRLVEGMPLGIELAAAWTRTFSCEAIADKIALNLSFLQHDDSSLTERHRSLLAMIDSFWFLLSDYERSLLRQLAVFRGGFDGSAARAIIDASPFFLEGLVAKGYLRWTRHKRYEIHELLRQYADEKLHALPDEEQQAHDRHSSYYLALVQRRDLQQFGSRHMLEEISVNLDNIRAAWQWAVQTSRLPELAQSFEGLEAFYEFKGMFHEAEALFAAAAERLQAQRRQGEPADPALLTLIGRLRAVQARFLIRCSRYDQAIQTAQAVCARAQELGDEGLEAIGAYHWGTALWHQGQYAAAQPHLTRAADIAQRLNLAHLHADSLRRLSRIDCEMGNYAEARAYGEQSLATCRQLGERQREARTLNDLGIVADSQGDFIASTTYYERGLQVCRELGDLPGEANALMNLGAVAADQGDYTRAERSLEHALRLFRAAGNLRDESIVLENLGDSARWQGELERATDYYEQALRICRRIGDQQGQSYLLGNLGLVAHQQSDHHTARVSSQQALEIAQHIGDSRAQGNALTYLGNAYSGMEQWDEAATHYQQAVQLYRELGQMHLCADALAGLAQIALQRGTRDEALTHIEPILEHLEDGTLDGTAEPFRIYLTCYHVLQAREDTRARDVLATAYTLLRQQAARMMHEERRNAFVYQIPVHRELLHAAQQHNIELQITLAAAAG